MTVSPNSVSLLARGMQSADNVGAQTILFLNSPQPKSEHGGNTRAWPFLPNAGLPTGLAETFSELPFSRRLCLQNLPFPSPFADVRPALGSEALPT